MRSLALAIGLLVLASGSPGCGRDAADGAAASRLASRDDGGLVHRRSVDAVATAARIPARGGLVEHPRGNRSPRSSSVRFTGTICSRRSRPRPETWGYRVRTRTSCGTASIARIARPPSRPRIPGQKRSRRRRRDVYRKHHARLLHYVRTTKDDLRSHYVERQRSDAYQWALLISTHEQRHILQIREIKADAKYPKK